MSHFHASAVTWLVAGAHASDVASVGTWHVLPAYMKITVQRETMRMAHCKYKVDSQITEIETALVSCEDPALRVIHEKALEVARGKAESMKTQTYKVFFNKRFKRELAAKDSRKYI
eukprot:TRINITY_DN119395_c0_g1_i1.p2 TRINITY_DN119395_c0_g1~~TRINITY_DN119395_c0_g1_i1.p2  ORF type:complete len:116 (-),score=16.52 TRINITY_DN119395_c0_g1_i1:169-516(-)